MYSNIRFLVLFCSLFFVNDALEAKNNINANPKAIVKSGNNVRFTVLTTGLFRMEYDSTGSFTNNASFIVVNRELPVPKYSVNKKSGWLIIKTLQAELRYKINSGAFTSQNLTVSYINSNKRIFSWMLGIKQSGNLKGTARTLDRYDGDLNNKGEKLELGEGILSTDGWFLLDDSQSFLFDNSEWPWVAQRENKKVQDWYIFCYGSNYKAALKDYTLIAGKVPLPPRYAFGYWWSRYWSYSDNELRNLVANFERFNVPLDVLVIDMDWHRTDSMATKKVDEFGERLMWTGWTWNKKLFPDPAKFLQWTKTKKLKTTLNLHPASGIAPYEAPYGEFAKKMNFDTTSRRNIPYEGSDKKFMKNLFEVVLRPMEKEGVDFWWLDWQQWLNDKKIEGLDNTWWLNYTFFTDMERNSNQRPMLYHRWGGLGNHRYQIGFSGDAMISWKSLEYQPYFTNTASNVLYGYWSHDIGGHILKRKNSELDPELYTRWMQYGALSPIFRTHSTKDPRLNKEIWNFRGDYFNTQYDAIQMRYQLVPYIYTMARKTYETGISLCRPMYYDYPDKSEAYIFDKQYQFGDDLLVAPIVKPMENGFSKVKVWLPEGNNWYEWHTGTLLKGGQIIEREFSLDEYPIYVKAGAIIPMYHNVRNLEKLPNKVTLGIFPEGSTVSRFYEDNGNDKDYHSQYAYTNIKSERLEDESFKIVISPREGTYKGVDSVKQYQLKLYGSQMPSIITLNGKSINYIADIEKKEGWHYKGSDLSVNITLPEMPCSERIEVIVYFDKNQYVDINNGLIEKFKRLSKATTELKFKKDRVVLPEAIGIAEETNLILEYHPKRFKEIIEKFYENYAAIPQSVKSLELPKDIEEWYLKSLIK